jgi:Kef-type K+ transport system membrane component KefB
VFFLDEQTSVGLLMAVRSCHEIVFMSNFELSYRVLLQIAFILAVCRLVGLMAKKLYQPQVVAEMFAGVLMGPSLFGFFLPELQSHLFPKASMTVLYAVSQLGLVLYMFLVGVEFQTELIRCRLSSVVSVSLAGILTPFTLGTLLAIFPINNADFFSSEVQLWQRMLFLGAAMSITAFPMLARIIHERGMTGTPLGTLTLAAGCLDDAAAWCILAVVLASFSRSPIIAISAIAGGVLYGLGTLTAGKRLLSRLGTMAVRNDGIDGGLLSVTLMILMTCAWCTDAIGIHAVFGAFILGAAMPRGIFARDLQRHLAPLTTNLLLPLFFVYSGLNTRIGLVNSFSLWVITLTVLFAACFGKGIACWLAARWNGETQRDSLSIGALMNSRGLMELILLNIGLERHIISPTLFTILVFMAVATTLMASPLFELVYRKERVPIPASPISASDGI